MSAPFPGALTLLAPCAVALLIAVTAYVAGRTLTRAVPAAGVLEVAVLSLCAGLLLLAQLGLALGLCGCLARGPVLAAFAALHLLGRRAWRELRSAFDHAREGRAARAAALSGMPPVPRPGRRIPPPAAAAAAALGVTLAAAMLLALYPPLGFDATLYHLPFAKAFAATGRLPFLPALRFPVFPQLDEMLLALALLLGGELAAQLVMTLATLLTVALLVAWGRSAFGEASGAGWLAAAALAGNPLVVYLAGSAYIDAGLALWVTAALYCLHRFRLGERRRRLQPAAVHAAATAPAGAAGAALAAGGQGNAAAAVAGQESPAPTAAGRDLPAASPRLTGRRDAVAWVVLAGAFAGGAAAGKYLGLFFVVAIGAIVAWTDRRRALWFAAVAAAVMAPWYGRIVYYTHNPVFPYFPQWFGHSPWDPLLFRPVLSAGAWASALGPHLLALVRLPWDLSFGWRSAGAVAPLSPAYLAALPLLAAALARDARIRRLLLLGVAFVFATLWLPREPRYVVAALPLLSMATGAALAPALAAAAARARPAAGRWFGIALCVALLLPGWLYGLDRLRRLGLPPVSAEQRDAWLARRLPLYPALRFLNRSRGAAYTAYGLQAENLKYFAAGTLLGDWTGPASFLRLPALDGDPDTFARALRRLGAGYLIVPAPPGPAGCGAVLHRRFQLLYDDARACVFDLAAAAPPGAGS